MSGQRLTLHWRTQADAATHSALGLGASEVLLLRNARAPLP